MVKVKHCFIKINKVNLGFTIVELLVVIVVIGILAAITVASYTGLARKAIASSLQSDLYSGARKLKLYLVDHAAYPASMAETSLGSRTYCPTPADTAYCLKSSSDNSLSYTASGGANPQGFTLDAINGDIKYRITESTAPVLVELTPITAIAAITGTPQVDEVLTAGAVTPGGAAVTYQWQISSTSNGTYTDIPGATNNTYTPIAGDATKFIRVIATGTGDYVGAQTSAATTSVLAAGLTHKQIAAGENHMCSIGSNDRAYCWGSNGYRQLGDNSTTSSSVPVAVYTAGVLNGKTIKSISAFYQHTCTIASDNYTYCWGDNGYGELGNNSTTSSAVPVAVYTAGVLSGKTIKSVAAGKLHTCAIASNDLSYCWGSGWQGQLGNNVIGSSSVPVAVITTGVLSGKTIKSISSGGFHSCVVASDNNAYCWGRNDSGQLGNNSTTQSAVPVAVNTSGVLSGKTIKSISAGMDHTCVIASDDLVYCWGYNYYGQLGNNSTTQSLVPVAVYTAGALSGKTIKSLASEYNHNCSTTFDNQAYCWGDNSGGQLGNNSYSQSQVPVSVYSGGILSGRAVTYAAVGYRHSCVIASNKAYCFGNNGYGQLGNNSTTESLVPVAVNPLP